MKPSDPSEEDLFAQCLELPADARAAFLDSVCKDEPELKANVLSLIESHEEHGGFLDSLEEEFETGGESDSSGPGRAQEGNGGRKPQSTPLLHYRVRKALRAYRPWGIAAIVLGIFGYVWFAYIGERSGDEAATTGPAAASLALLAPSRIAVLPFQAQGADETAIALAEGIRLYAQKRMERVEGIELVPEERVVALGDLSFSDKELWVELKAGTLLVGDVQAADDRVRIRAQLVDTVNESTIPSESYTRFLGDVDLIAKEIGCKVADAAIGQIANNYLSLYDPLSHSTEAVEAYQSGMALLGTGALTTMPEAIAIFERALQRDPNFALAYVGLGNARQQEEQLTPQVIPEEERIAAMKKAAERALVIDPALPEAHVLLGLAKKLAGNRAGALGAFEDALRIDPNCAVAHMERAQWEFEKRIPPWEPGYQDYMDTVLVMIQKSIDCDPSEARFYYEMGHKLSYLGRVNEARKFYERSIAANPKYAKGYLGLAGNYKYFQGRFDEALPHFRRAFALDPLNVECFTSLAECYESVGDLESAAQIKKRLLGFREDLVLNYQGDVYRLQGEIEKAIAHYRSVFEGNWMHPSLDSIRRRLLNFDLRQNNIELARARYYSHNEHVYEGFKLFEDNPEVRSLNEALFAMEIAPIRLALGETEAAMQLVEGSCAAFQRIPDTDHVRAFYETMYYALKGQKEEAIEVLRDAVDSGFRSKLDLDDARLDSLRSEPAFEAIQAIVDADMARQLANIRRMEASGELVPLPEVAEPL